MYYLCSLGSNIEPQQHLSLAIGQLSEWASSLLISSVIQTKPVAMQSRHDFLNCLLVMESTLNQSELKACFIALEIRHGRDRGHPQSKLLDRPLDIDILACRSTPDFAALAVDSYLSPLQRELFFAVPAPHPKVELHIHSNRQEDDSAWLCGLQPTRWHAP